MFYVNFMYGPPPTVLILKTLVEAHSLSFLLAINLIA